MNTQATLVSKITFYLQFAITIASPFYALGAFGYSAHYVATNDTWLDHLTFYGFVAGLVFLPVYCVFGFSLIHWGKGLFDRLKSRTNGSGIPEIVGNVLHAVGYPIFGAYIGHAWRIGENGTGLLMVTVGTVALAAILYWYYHNVFDFEPATSPAGKEQVAQENPASANAEEAYSFDFRHPTNGLDSLAGMADLKQELRTFTGIFADYKDKKSTISDRNGLLLSGPPGNGKTAFAEAIAGELGLRFVKVNISDIASKWVNESPMVLKSLFAQAAKAPTVVFFDEFDAIAASRGGNSHSEDKKAVNALLALIDDARKQKIVLIAATNFPENIDPAIARDGRFDFRVEIPYPDLEARTAILTGLLAKNKVKADPGVVAKVAALWERRSVAFIEGAVKRLRDNGLKAAPTIDDFKAVAREAGRRPSAIPKDGPKISELALPASVRDESDSLIYRLKNWESVAEQGGEVPSGVLLYGPPGTGKTAFVRALARELGHWHVFEVNTTEVVQNPNKFRELVEMAANHRPAFIFLDEADELLRERNGSFSAGATNEILKCMDGMMGKVPEVVFIAATNNPEAIDAAAVRGGRFAEKIFMPRLQGDDLVNFLAKEFSGRNRGTFTAEVNPLSLAEELGPIAPADALAVLRKAVSYGFGAKGARPVQMEDVLRAKDAILT